MPSSGTGRVYRRGKVWWIEYSHRGKQYRESSRSRMKTVAVELLKKRLAEQGSGQFIGPSVERIVFDDLVAGLKVDYRINGQRTWDRTELSIRHLRAFFGANARAIDITTARITTYIVDRQDAGAAAATIKRELMALSRMFKLAQADRGGPLASQPTIPTIRVNNTRRGFLDGAELDAVIAELAGALKPVIEFARYTGWRRGEILALEWARVDFEAGTIRLDTSKNDQGRSFPFSVLPPLAALLRTQYQHSRDVERERGMIVPWVFHRQGQRIKSMRRAWNAACARAGVPGQLVHDLRRTAVRNLVRAGVDEKTAMTLVGHKTRSIFDRYNIVNDRDQREAVARLAEHLGSRQTDPRTILPLRKDA